MASASPRRRDFLERLGLDFHALAVELAETPFPHEEPQDFALRMAQAKAEALADSHPDAWVIGADTIVTRGNLILGKPKDPDHALSMLQQLNGHEHLVLSAYALICRAEGHSVGRVVATKVTFHEYPAAVLAAYVRTGEPLDKAGAYGIQGIGSFLVREISGSCTNVIGLPVSDLIADLLHYGVVRPVWSLSYLNSNKNL